LIKNILKGDWLIRKFYNQKGFTLLELIVVIAVIGILSAIAAPKLFGIVDRAKITADQATVRILNDITPLYRVTKSSLDPFKDEEKSNEELIEVLVNSGYLTSYVEPQSKDATFTWLFDAEQWYLAFPDSFYLLSKDDVTSIFSNGMLGYWSSGVAYTGSSKDIVIPVALDGTNITHIGQDAFRATGLVAVSFEDGSKLDQIHARSFKDNNLTSISLPDSVTKIDRLAFYGNNLKEITLGSNITRIEFEAFSENPLNRITIGSNVTGIEENAFGQYTDSFKDAYTASGAGIYVLNGEDWVKE